ncbi:hypothetical protein KAR91_31175 [Candidatus Pacearchaeota archaeon]|nr:hypothetical protein [Candidatus Pacearchaeota archaeon]
MIALKEIRDLKKQEQLYNVFLDLWYSNKENEMLINDATKQLKDLKNRKKKINKSLIKVKDVLKEITGQEPTEPKQG